MRSYNYSALSTAQKCPQLYKYKYIDKLPESGAESGDIHFGTAMHVGVESILTGESDGLFEFDAYWKSVKEKQLKFTRFGYEDLYDQGIRLLTRFKRLYVKKFEVVQMEQTLTGTLEGVGIYGTPDFIGSYEGKPSIVDFKTAKSRYVRERIISSEQLYLYAHLAKQSLNYQAEQVVYFQFIKGTEPGISVLRYEITPSIYEESLSNIARQLHHWQGVKDTDQFIRNKSSCVMGDISCPFFDKCYPNSREG